VQVRVHDFVHDIYIAAGRKSSDAEQDHWRRGEAEQRKADGGDTATEGKQVKADMGGGLKRVGLKKPEIKHMRLTFGRRSVCNEFGEALCVRRVRAATAFCQASAAAVCNCSQKLGRPGRGWLANPARLVSANTQNSSPEFHQPF
jgi:hypothetical protein